MLGDSHLALSRLRKARDAYYLARQIKGDDADAWADVAKAALALRDAPRAILAAREALRIDEGCLDALLVLGCALLLDRQAEQAAATLSGGLALHGRNGTLRCLLGKAHATMGDPRTARRWYQEAIRDDPDSQLARALLAEPPWQDAPRSP